MKLFEDRWWNTMANNESYTYLMTNRIGYIYLKDSKGQGHIIVPLISLQSLNFFSSKKSFILL